ncbi:15281_t:CDS:2 [Entrophospora sp. SA101]|nr:15281_t:CDS:2 [Entrophospora sp. SA101]
MDPLLGHSQAPPSIFAQEGTEESAPQASGIATRKMISSSSYENFFRSPDFFL